MVILFGAVGSAGLIFSVLFLFFLGSQISSHPPMSTDTISEMMGYAEFFLFSFTSYFVVAISILKLRNVFQRYVPGWVPISLFGSLIFCLSFFTRVWISEVSAYREGDPFRSPAPTYVSVIISALVVASILTLVIGTFSAIASAIYSGLNAKTEIELNS